MSDMADDAQKIAEHLIKVAAYQSRRDEPNIEATGFCHYCDEPIELPRRWCDKQCCEDWERENQ
jgi:hypothetical protein